MKAFLFNFIILSILLLATSAFVEYLLLFQTNPYSYKHKYVMTHLDDLQILLMGNSHIQDGVIPDSIGYGAFNTAIAGRLPYYDAQLLKQYLPKMKNIRVVVMPLDYLCFYFGRDKKNPNNTIPPTNMRRTYRCMYYKYMGVKDDIWYWPELLNSKMRFINRFFQTSKSSRECDSLGNARLKLKNRKKCWENRGLPKLIDTSIPKDINKYNRLYEIYHSIATVTAARNTKLILIGTPLYENYLEDMNPDVVIEMHDFAKKLMGEFPNTEYYDFSFDPRFNSDDFNDASHLSEVGAIKFSRILRDIIKY